jgi:hypothetical protein
MRARILAGVAAAALLCGALPARADDDPPARVGRLADVSGAVSLRPDPTQPWAVAARNQPVTSGMWVWTEPQARAALEIGPAELHLGDQAELDIQQLDDRAFAAQLGQGSVNIDIAELQAGETWSVDTPRGTVTLDRPGEYRIDAGTTQDPTQVVVFSGEAQVAGGPDGPVDIQGGETGVVTGSDPFSYALAPSADRGPLDDWAEGRIRAASAAPRYVSRAMTGYQDLAAAGTWHEIPTYGTVWYPTDVPADWAPYRYGRWDHDDRWGWTWIDDQPWGFAPFHYGRWARVDDRWGWVPGPVEAHPVYAPALVSFFAGAALGAAVTAAVDSHPIGWYPLGPGEIYRPPYRVSDTYVRNLNVTNIRNVEINNIHNGPTTIVEDGANRRFATVVPAQVLAGRQPVAHAALPVTADQLEHARLTPVATLPHPEAPTAGQPQAPHPAQARAPGAPGPGGRLPLAAADPNRPHPSAPSQPAHAVETTHGPAGQPQGPAPDPQRGPAAPIPAQGAGKPPLTSTGNAQAGHPPLLDRNQRGPAAPGGPTAPQAQPGRPPLPERGQRPASGPNAAVAPKPTLAAPQALARPSAGRQRPQAQATAHPPPASQPHPAARPPMQPPRNAAAPLHGTQPQPHRAPPPQMTQQRRPQPQAEHRPPPPPLRRPLPPPDKRQQQEQN